MSLFCGTGSWQESALWEKQNEHRLVNLPVVISAGFAYENKL